MKINRDIKETKTFMLIAKEIAANCPLEDVYHSDSFLEVLVAFADASSQRTSEQLINDFPVLVASLVAIDNDIRSFDWELVAQALDVLSGKAGIIFEG